MDAMAALLVRDAGALRRGRDHQHVRRHPVGRGLGDLPAASGSPPRSTPAASTRMAQAQHGSAPDIAGQDRANPASLIGSAAMLLAWLGERRGDERLTQAARRSSTRSTGRSPPAMAHARSRRPARHQGVRRAGRGAGGGGGARSSEDRGSAYRNHAKPGWSRAATRADR